MQKLYFDAQYMPEDGTTRALLEARCDLTRWVEAKPVLKINSYSIADFFKEITNRFGFFIIAVIDGGPENKAAFREHLDGVGIYVI
jgi:hypothetical protein